MFGVIFVFVFEFVELCFQAQFFVEFQKQFEKLERPDVKHVADVKLSKAHY